MFVGKVVERVVVGVEEAIMIVIYSLYMYSYDEMMAYELDFIGLAIILLLHVCRITYRVVVWRVYGVVEGDVKVG